MGKRDARCSTTVESCGCWELTREVEPCSGEEPKDSAAWGGWVRDGHELTIDDGHLLACHLFFYLDMTQIS